MKTKIKGKEGYKQGVTLEGNEKPKAQYEPDDEIVDFDEALREVETKNPAVLDPIAAAAAAAGLSPSDVGEVNKDAGMENTPAPAGMGSISATAGTELLGDPSVQGIGSLPAGGYDLVEAKEDAILMCAKLCHAVIKAYNDAFGEVTLSWDQSRPSTVKGVRFALDNPGVTPEQSHESWLAEKKATGWIYGPTKSAEHKTHPCIKPYEALPPRQKVKDQMFLAIVKTFFGL